MDIKSILQANGGKLTTAPQAKSNADISSILQKNGGKLQTSSQDTPTQSQGAGGLPGLADAIVSPFVNASMSAVRTAGGVVGGLAGLATAGVGEVTGNKGLEDEGIDIAKAETNPNIGVGGAPITSQNKDTAGAPIQSTEQAVGIGATIGSYVAPLAAEAAPVVSGVSKIWNAVKGGALIGGAIGLGQSTQAEGKSNDSTLSNVLNVGASTIGGAGIGAILGAGTEAAGSAIGEGMDFASNVVNGIKNEGKSLGESLGAAFENVKSDVQDKYSQIATDKWNKQEKGTLATQKQSARSAASGKSPQALLGKLGIDPSDLVEKGKFALDKVTSAMDSVVSSVAPLEEQFDKMLKVSDYSTPATSVEDLKSQAIKQAESLKNTSATKIESIVSNIKDGFDAMGRKYGDAISNFSKNAEKKGVYADTTFDSLKPFKGDANKIIGNVLRKSIEDTVDNVNVQEFNKVVGGFYDAADYLKSFSGKKAVIPFSSKVMSAAIKTAGTAIGESLGGPVSGVVGYMTSRGLSSALEDMSNPLREYIFSTMAKDSPDILQQMIDYMDSFNKAQSDSVMGQGALPEAGGTTPNPLGSDKNPIIPQPPTPTKKAHQ